MNGTAAIVVCDAVSVGVTVTKEGIIIIVIVETSNVHGYYERTTVL